MICDVHELHTDPVVVAAIHDFDVHGVGDSQVRLDDRYSHPPPDRHQRECLGIGSDD